MYAFFRLRQAGLAQYQAVLIVRGQLILAHSTEYEKLENFQYRKEIESRHIVDDKTLGRIECKQYNDVSWSLQKLELVPAENLIKAQSASSTIGPVFALVQAGWSLLNGVERLVHKQALSGLDAIGLQYSILSILTAAETIFIPNIGHDFVRIINETKQESLGQNVSTVGSEISMIHIILPFTIYVLGAWLQTQVDFPSYAIRLAPHLTLAAFASCRSLNSYHHTRSLVQPSSRIGADTVTGTEGAHGGGNGDKLREVLISERVEMATSAFPELRSQSPLALWLAPKGNSSSPAGCQSPIAEVGLAEVGLGDYPTIVVVTTDDIKSLPTSVFGCLEHEVRAEAPTEPASGDPMCPEVGPSHLAQDVARDTYRAFVVLTLS
ncbi:hypothetical protein BC938DRAFT_472213 [Jimgerdemannia flammicorona]|uniref:Uncharacterized protein n=1 Tax=Jimgerdemannia flammicorona TaxID=994334 RepID=A0A433QU57_9FUNG|nr:hypothetical protein BC938DRAFT_472213 [Jimgerdemannia flammicorona]